MKTNEVAKLTGLTVRTLQYYDRIDLLKPSEVLDNGYRNYSTNDLKRLQEILFFRELDFPLNEIKAILSTPSYDEKKALQNQKQLLLKKREHIDGLLSLLESTLKGDNTMSFKEFDQKEYKDLQETYAKEVKERWGNTPAYNEYEKKTKGANPNQQMLYAQGVNEILKEFAEIRTLAPEDDKAQVLVKKWQDYITEHFYTCTKQILSCLGLMYVGDERFRRNIDQQGEGTAQFMADAIEYYCNH